MADVDPPYAEWLQSDSMKTVAIDGTIGAAWGSLADDIGTQCNVDTEADALASGLRILAFRRGPLVQEEVTIADVLDVSTYRGRCWTITAPGFPVYAAGCLVFVLGGAADYANGTTTLQIVRPI